MDITHPEIDAYAEAHTTPPPEHLVAVAEETRRSLESPGMMVGSLEGRFLEMLVFASGAKRILEIGTFSGYSSLSMAAGLADGGKIVTCDIRESVAEVARRHIDASPHAGKIEVRVGPALDTISTLDGPFDLVFIDADKESYAAYLDAVLPKLAERGLVVVDNTLWSGRVLDDGADDASTTAIKAFNDDVVARDDLVVVQLTIRDGITLIRKAR